MTNVANFLICLQYRKYSCIEFCSLLCLRVTCQPIKGDSEGGFDPIIRSIANYSV